MSRRRRERAAVQAAKWSALTEPREMLRADYWCARCKGRGYTYTYTFPDPEWCEWCGGAFECVALYDEQTMERIYGEPEKPRPTLTEPPDDQRCEFCEWPSYCEEQSCFMASDREIAGEREEV